MDQILFFYQSPLPHLRNRMALKKFLLSTAKKYKRPIASLNIIFCDDAYLLDINNRFLGHNFYTDIITFDLDPTLVTSIEGEIYISTERVKDNAKAHGVSYVQEMHRVIFHGLLHLLGYKDKLKKDQLTMRSMEDKLLMLYFDRKRS